MTLRTFYDEAAWIGAVLAELRDAAAAARAAGRNLHLCLAGGTTPAPVYRAMATEALRGMQVELWLGDERVVRSDDPARNGVLVSSAFAASAWAPPPRIHLWPPAGPEAVSDGGVEAACAAYAAELAASLGTRPAFDLALLGLGPDGHTASLFPGQAVLRELQALAAPSTAPSPPLRRMSLTYPALRGARRLRFLVRGPDKLAIVERLERGEKSLPAAGIGAADEAILYCATI